ncbi:MAG: hypothetical protein KBT59_02335 [Sphingomonadales bacterium]|nr:hypothetical protein [Sphingomonadales bacterium]
MYICESLADDSADRRLEVCYTQIEELIPDPRNARTHSKRQVTQIALNAGWDVEVLKLELADLSLPEVDIDLGLTGFSPGEIDVVLADSEDPDDEVISAVPENPRVQFGDIWQLGEHRVACGDGRDAAFLQKVVGKGASIDCAFLDPPYNVKINGHANAKGRHREFAMASGEMNEPEFRTFLADTLGA